MYMFPTAEPTVLQKSSTLNLWPLWRSIRVWAVTAALFTNHTNFLDSRVLTDSNWVIFALKSSGKQGLLLWGSEGCYLASKLWKLHMHKHAIFLEKMCISHLFSLGSALASIKMATHLIRVQDRGHKILIYIHPHYFHCAILPSNYRKIHCLLLPKELCRSLQADGENTAYEQPGSVSGPLSLYPGM